MTTPTTTSLDRAIAKSRKQKCHARRLYSRTYLITTPEKHRYVVRMEMRDGLRWAVCNCKAGSVNQHCFHIIPAAVLDSALISRSN